MCAFAHINHSVCIFVHINEYVSLSETRSGRCCIVLSGLVHLIRTSCHQLVFILYQVFRVSLLVFLVMYVFFFHNTDKCQAYKCHLLS